MKSRQTLSIRGVMGACYEVEPHEQTVMHLVTRLCSNCSCSSDKVTIDNIVSHHTGDVLKHHVHCGNVIFPLFPRDMECMSENCPSVMVDDHVRCWN